MFLLKLVLRLRLLTKMEQKEFSRNKIQETAMQIMYGFLIMQELGLEIDVKEGISNACNLSYAECDLFLKDLIIKALKNESSTIELISQNLNKWKFNRLNTCVQAILILAVTNVKYCEVDKAAAINIAVKLTKKYAEPNDYKFVNAVLDNSLNG